MAIEIYRASLTLLEHTYFASREVGTLYETEPLIGNYALAYAFGFCHAPYYWNGPPRYKLDLAPLNTRGIYVTPGTFVTSTLKYAFSQFNAQTDSYYSRFDQNAIATIPEKKARPTNFPQSGKIRMLGRDSEAFCFLFNLQGESLRLPSYIRLGKFNSKARVQWEQLTLLADQPEERDITLDILLNAVDLSPSHLATLRAFSLYNIHPAPLLSHCSVRGRCWCCRRSGHAETLFLPADMRFGVDTLT